MKKIMFIISIIVGGLILLSVVVPMIIGLVLKAQPPASSISVIGGADGPTTIMLAGVVGGGSVFVEIIIGIFLVIIGIWGFRNQNSNY